MASLFRCSLTKNLESLAVHVDVLSEAAGSSPRDFLLDGALDAVNDNLTRSLRRGLFLTSFNHLEDFCIRSCSDYMHSFNAQGVSIQDSRALTSFLSMLRNRINKVRAWEEDFEKAANIRACAQSILAATESDEYRLPVQLFFTSSNASYNDLKQVIVLVNQFYSSAFNAVQQERNWNDHFNRSLSCGFPGWGANEKQAAESAFAEILRLRNMAAHDPRYNISIPDLRLLRGVMWRFGLSLAIYLVWCDEHWNGGLAEKKDIQLELWDRVIPVASTKRGIQFQLD